ncbi:hypothetical protein EVAR_16376_1 [Eumeta japonica]|uniref:Uncharacterized protein n=1 Tax=Eumeta variegata TaxID=151549 RepID=A0A4C1VUS3_EUMVA|nr:hypothetical protein EVAR_16376_1 [Eumeta japonica]
MRQTLCSRLISTLLTSNMRSHTYFDSLGAASAMAKILDGKALALEVNNELKLKSKLGQPRVIEHHL